MRGSPWKAFQRSIWSDFSTMHTLSVRIRRCGANTNFAGCLTVIDTDGTNVSAFCMSTHNMERRVQLEINNTKYSGLDDLPPKGGGSTQSGELPKIIRLDRLQRADEE